MFKLQLIRADRLAPAVSAPPWDRPIWLGEDPETINGPQASRPRARRKAPCRNVRQAAFAGGSIDTDPPRGKLGGAAFMTSGGPACYIKRMTAADIELDEELLELLHEEGIDPEWVKAQQAEMARFKRTPEEEAKLAAEREELRESTEAYKEYYARNGSLSDHVRNLARPRT